MVNVFVFLLGFFLIPTGFAWNAQGHILVAELAQQYLSPSARIYVQHIQDTGQMGGKTSSLADTAIWMDKYYSPKYRFLRKCHYIDIPEGDKRFFPTKNSPYNALFAIDYAKRLLMSPTTTREEKAFAMRVLVHVVADIHQPMHTINWYSSRYPLGDRGGNLVKIKSRKIAKNMHSFWDKGGGWLNGSPEDIQKKIQTLSYKSCSGMPKDWVATSHEIAKNKAYPFHHSKTYMLETQDISKHQLQQAACHLALILEDLSRTKRVWA